MRLLAVFCLLGLGHARPLAADFKVPAFSAPVVDQAGMLQPQTLQSLDGALQQLWSQGGSQVAVLTVPDLGGLEIEQASIKVTDAWKLGAKKKDNGVLILIAKAEHKIRIEVGYGLEGDLTDIYCSGIIRDDMVPLMRQGNVDDAVLVGVARVLQKSDPNYKGLQQFAVSRPDPQGQQGNLPGAIFIIIFVVIFGVLRILGSIFGIGRGPRGGYWGGGFGSGGGGFGGGGFGGGGGGGFGGGGASGGW